VQLRGGRKSDKSSSSSKGRSTSKGSKKGKSKKRSKYEVVQWDGNRKKSSGFGAAAGLKERLEKLAKTGQAAYKDVYRRAKVVRSSAFEGLLLKATWPGDDPVPADILHEIVKYSIPAFKFSSVVSVCVCGVLCRVFSVPFAV
jgi:hypothetical protein